MTRLGIQNFHHVEGVNDKADVSFGNPKELEIRSDMNNYAVFYYEQSTGEDWQVNCLEQEEEEPPEEPPEEPLY